MTEIDSGQFFAVTDSGVRGAMVVRASGGQLLDGRSLLRGERRADVPVALEPALGTSPLDLIVGTDVATMLVSRKTIDVLVEGGITGWSTYPITLQGYDGRSIDGYDGLSITGRCGPLDPSTNLEWQPPRQPGAQPYKAWVGLSFAPDTWDGSDLFMPDDKTLWVIATEYAQSRILSAKLRNFEFQRLSDVKLLRPIERP